jgi:hypothetical protein
VQRRGIVPWQIAPHIREILFCHSERSEESTDETPAMRGFFAALRMTELSF